VATDRFHPVVRRGRSWVAGSEIERIEVIRGPVSSIYGADAIGGGNGFDLLLGANYREGDDYETPIGTAENSAFEAKSLDFKLGYKPSDYTRWELDMRC
jgi:hypothetical protein